MKTQVKKIIMTAVVLLLVSVGVSFAHDGDRKHHKHRGKAHGHYQSGYHERHDWHNKHHKHLKHTYRHYKKWHRHHYRWYKWHHKRWHHFRDRHNYRKGYGVHRHRHHYNDHRASYEGAAIKFKLKEPGFIFAVVVEDHR
jgi:hypothetical protein